MLRYRENLSDDQIYSCQHMTHQLWGGDESLEARLSNLQWQLAFEGGAILQYTGLVDTNNSVLSSCKKYTVYVSHQGRQHKALGLGAIFTAPEMRCRGLASLLIRHVLKRAQGQGYTMALLYSDIDPSYYARFGFMKLNANNMKVPTNLWDGSAISQSLELKNSSDAPKAYFEKHMSVLSLAPFRTEALWNYARKRYGPLSDYTLWHSDKLVGYISLHEGKKIFWIEELFVDHEYNEPFWQLIAHMCKNRNYDYLEGWEPSAYPNRVKNFLYARKEAIPMICLLNHQSNFLFGAENSWFGHLDHF